MVTIVKNQTTRESNRWLILIACILINLCLGAGYAWSVFQTPLIETFGWTTAEASLAFSLSFGLVPVGMIIFGPIQDKKGPKMITFGGGILFGLGMLSTGFISSLTGLYLTYGVMLGIGIGMAYGCCVATPVKWFPDKRGLAGGLTAAGFGSGAIVFAPLAVYLIEKFSVMTTFKILGVLFLIVICVCSLFIKAPQIKKEEKKESEKSERGIDVSAISNDATPREMLKTGKFYLLWVMYIIGCISGLMIIGHASPIAQEQIGLTPQIAAVSVSIIGLANTLGRIFWGSVSDKLGRYNTLIIMYIVAGIMMVLLNGARSFSLFIITVSGIALCFGGFMGIFPSITADNFGTKNLGVNYGVVFTAFGLAAIIAPRMAAIIKESAGGDYGRAFIIAAILSVVGIVMTFLVISKMKKEKSISLDV